MLSIVVLIKCLGNLLGFAVTATARPDPDVSKMKVWIVVQLKDLKNLVILPRPFVSGLGETKKYDILTSKRTNRICNFSGLWVYVRVI